MEKNGCNLPESLHLVTFGSIRRSLGTIRDHFSPYGNTLWRHFAEAALESRIRAWFGRYCIKYAKYTGNSHCLSGMHVEYAIVGRFA